MSAPIGNKYAIGNNGGRPPKFDSPEHLMEECEAYFKYIEGEFHYETEEIQVDGKFKVVDKVVWDRYSEPATITGLTLYLGFSDRGSLDDYEKKEEFSHIIKRARKLVEHNYEKRLHGDKNTGAIFALKNMGWKDKTEVENTNLNFNSEPIPAERIKQVSNDLEDEC
jgi:hypothetical protein